MIVCCVTKGKNINVHTKFLVKEQVRSYSRLGAELLGSVVAAQDFTIPVGSLDRSERAIVTTTDNEVDAIVLLLVSRIPP